MAQVLAGLQPVKVFEYFEMICAVPHGSRDTKKISDFCVRFATQRGLPVRQDEHNNVIIWKGATAGYETHPTVILQGHLDMVCEKEPDCDIDFTTDGLRLRVEGDMISADGTTLGGDDGIAVAYALALLDSDSIPHPPLEIVLTVDEEIGMLGATDIDLSMLKGRILLNIDSEDEGILTVSCAGGATSTVTLPVCREGGSGKLFTICVDGLQGGHSGVEIHKGRCNANKLLGELLEKMLPLQLASIDGGQKDNAIPRSAVARFFTHDATNFEAAKQDILNKYRTMEPNLQITMQEETADADAIVQSEAVVALLNKLPNGVQAMSREIEGLVQTSLNLGILKTCDNCISMTFSVRSSVNTEKADLIQTLKDTGAEFGAEYSQMGEYPAWEYCHDSKLRPLMVSTFEELYGKEPVVEAIHAGLECGILADKLPGLDAVSFGPDMTDIHTTREQLSVSSVRRTWDYLCAVLARI